jgi:hypothetical protein
VNIHDHFLVVPRSGESAETFFSGLRLYVTDTPGLHFFASKEGNHMVDFKLQGAGESFLCRGRLGATLLKVLIVKPTPV